MHPEAPLIQYHQKSSNSCYFSSLVSPFNCIGDNRADSALINCIEESLTLQKQIKNRIHFVNTTIKNRRIIKCEQNLKYNLTMWKKNDDFDILNDIGEDVTLLKLMESL